MKLLTLNCHSWQEENQFEKIKYLAETINENDYDVIALQEVSQSINTEIIRDNLRKDNFALLLKQELDKYQRDKYDFCWDFSHIGYDVYEEGLAIFTKHKLEKVESFFISKSQDINYWKSRKIIKASIKYDDNEMDFYSCHLGWWNDEDESFKYQADNLMKSINDEKATLLMGDFNNNAFIKNEGYDYLIKSGLKDLYVMSENDAPGVTVKGKIDGWDKNTEKLRLDLILSNETFKINYAEVIFNGKNKEVISDHYGVEIDLE